MNNETLAKDILDDTWLLVSGTWHGRDHTANPANSAILYGNLILLCQKLREASFLVPWNKLI